MSRLTMMASNGSKRQDGLVILLSLFLSLIIVLGFLALLLSISNLDIVRYQRQGAGAYKSIYGQLGTVDVAFGGTSRSARGFYAPFLKDSLAPYFDEREPVIYDLSICGHGADVQIRVLLDLLEHRNVKYIFFQSYHIPFIEPPTHPRLRTIGTLEDILQTPIKNRSTDVSLTHRSQLLYQRIASMLDFCLNPKDPLSCFRNPIVTPAKSFDPSSPRRVAVTRQLRLLRERKEKRNGNYFKDKQRKWDFNRGNDYRTGFYLDLLVKKAKENGATVVLVDFPEFEGNTLTEGFPESVKRRFGVEYLYLNRQELLDLGKYGFGDFGHVNIRGEKIIRNMIVRYFASERESTP